jgi:hypothetical protein
MRPPNPLDQRVRDQQVLARSDAFEVAANAANGEQRTVIRLREFGLHGESVKGESGFGGVHGATVPGPSAGTKSAGGLDERTTKPRLAA